MHARRTSEPGVALCGKTRCGAGSGRDTAQVIGKRRSPGGPAASGGGLQRGLALLVAGAFFMEILDGTVIAPAAPHIAADFGVPAVAINVAITAYVLTLAVLIPISGWLADRFGARRIFMTAHRDVHRSPRSAARSRRACRC